MQINLMQRAIDEAKKFKTPFGAVLFNGQRMIVAANSAKRDGKVHHAEMNAMLKMPVDFKLKDQKLELFTTCEPCPMCMGAAIWAGVDQIYFGVSIEQATQYFNQIQVKSDVIAEASFRNIELMGEQMQSECLELFKLFAK